MVMVTASLHLVSSIATYHIPSAFSDCVETVNCLVSPLPDISATS